MREFATPSVYQIRWNSAKIGDFQLININLYQNSQKMCEFATRERTKTSENPTRVSGTFPFWHFEQSIPGVGEEGGR